MGAIFSRLANCSQRAKKFFLKILLIPDSPCGNMLKTILHANRGLQSLQKKNTGNNIKFRGKNQVWHDDLSDISHPWKRQVILKSALVRDIPRGHLHVTFRNVSQSGVWVNVMNEKRWLLEIWPFVDIYVRFLGCFFENLLRFLRIWSSYMEPFFKGDWLAARLNPLRFDQEFIWSN